MGGERVWIGALLFETWVWFHFSLMAWIIFFLVQVLEQDEANVSVLVQRALLYESMEKYRLGAEDLRTVLKIDPGNRIARSTIHRLTKLAD